MADYFPLITRAVSALDPNTPERREAIYARAREALDRQLTSLDPPIPESDLRRERGALEATIRRVEQQFATPPPAFRPDANKPSGPLDRGGEAERAPPQAPVPEPVPAEALEEAAVRPKVRTEPRVGLRAGRRWRLIAALGLPVAVLIAVAAYVMRDDPARYLAQPAPPPAAADGSASAPGRKNDGRLDGTGVAGPATGPRPGPAAPEQPVLPVASRVLFFEETQSDPRGVQSDGMVIWSLEQVPAAQGRPADQRVRGAINVANANMAIDMVFKRNLDAALPASHTIELIFRPTGDREGVRDISLIEARDQETNPGAALQGAVAPIGINLFLIGLERSDASIVRNVEALRDRKWFAFQFRSVSGKLGAVLIEKGPTGERVFREALEAWK
jgi:hypothetical protein